MCVTCSCRVCGGTVGDQCSVEDVTFSDYLSSISMICWKSNHLVMASRYNPYKPGEERLIDGVCNHLVITSRYYYSLPNDL